MDTSKKTTLHFVIAGVLMNGYIQGSQNKNLDTSVINVALKEIISLIEESHD